MSENNIPMDISLLKQSSFQFDYILGVERAFNAEQTLAWFERNWTLTFAISAAYVAVIFGLQYYMQHRPKYDLRSALTLWSGVLALFSMYCTIRMLSEGFYVAYRHGWEYSVCNPSIYYGDTAFVSFIFVASKAYELGDTIFIVLRKQPLIFLHWYHHITVMIYSSYTYAYYYAPGRWFAGINSMVHSFMYTYYFLRVIRVSLPRGINKCVTTIQILQMVFGIYVNLSAKWVLDRGEVCYTTNDNIKYSLLMYASYFILFAHFFYNAYMKPKDVTVHKRETVKNEHNATNIQSGTPSVQNGHMYENGYAFKQKHA